MVSGLLDACENYLNNLAEILDLDVLGSVLSKKYSQPCATAGYTGSKS